MPKSKRNKQVELAKTKKHGFESKKHLFEQIRNCVDTYANLFVFSVNDMRNGKMKNVREQWKHSRFFIGKNKVMAIALGRIREEEYRPNLHKISEQLKGQRGLLFSNQSTEEVLSWFRSYSEGDYARSGNIATESVSLCEGPLPQFPHDLEPYLRQLGLPTSLMKGVIHLIKNHEVCKIGDTLTPETAKILKLLGYEMAEFHIKIESVWSTDGTYMNLSSDSLSEDFKSITENIIEPVLKSLDITNKENGKHVEVNLQDSVEKNQHESITIDSESEEEESVAVKTVNKDNESEFVSSSLAPNLSMETEKVNENHMDVVELPEEISSDTASKFIVSTPKQKSEVFEFSDPKTEDNLLDVSNDDLNSSSKNDEEITIVQIVKNNIVQEEQTIEKNNSEEDNKFVGQKDSPIKFPSKSKKEDLIDIEENVINSKEENSRKSRPRKRNENEDLKEDISKNEKISRPVRAVRKTVENNTPLNKKVDHANSSQDSPAFLELRNRSVKVSRKKRK